MQNSPTCAKWKVYIWNALCIFNTCGKLVDLIVHIQISLYAYKSCMLVWILLRLSYLCVFLHTSFSSLQLTKKKVVKESGKNSRAVIKIFVSARFKVFDKFLSNGLFLSPYFGPVICFWMKLNLSLCSPSAPDSPILVALLSMGSSKLSVKHKVEGIIWISKDCFYQKRKGPSKLIIHPESFWLLRPLPAGRRATEVFKSK